MGGLTLGLTPGSQEKTIILELESISDMTCLQLLLLGKKTFMVISVKLCEIWVNDITTASVIPITSKSARYGMF